MIGGVLFVKRSGLWIFTVRDRACMQSAKKSMIAPALRYFVKSANRSSRGIAVAMMLASILQSCRVFRPSPTLDRLGGLRA
jgi:hypothetical protein